MGGINKMNWKKIVLDYVFRRDNKLCSLCNKEIFTTDAVELDHIIPISKNGGNKIENLRLVHYICHRRRHKQTRALIVDNDKPNESIIVVAENFDYKTGYEIEALKAIKVAYQEEGTISGAAQKIKMTNRQVRYLISKHKLPPIPSLWSFLEKKKQKHPKE